MARGLTRREWLKLAGSGTAAALSLGIAPGFSDAAQRTRVRVGYLHTLAVDAQIWLAHHMGTWEKQGLRMEFTRFHTGLGMFQALVGGSLDILATGAVISNFPARGQGKVFMINDVEWATAQLWVRPGIKSIKDLKGKKIATTRGTTAHVFLYTALKHAGLDPNKDVQLVNQPMNAAVTSFIAGAVPAVALWVPFNLVVEKHVPKAHMLVDASKYYPQAAIVDGWAARNDVFKNQQDMLAKVIKGWVPANDFLVNHPQQALELLHKTRYSDVSVDQLHGMFKAEKVFSSKKWTSLYRDGTVTKWLEHVTDVFVGIGAIEHPVKASNYFDPKPYLAVVGS